MLFRILKGHLYNFLFCGFINGYSDMEIRPPTFFHYTVDSFIICRPIGINNQFWKPNEMGKNVSGEKHQDKEYFFHFLS